MDSITPVAWRWRDPKIGYWIYSDNDMPTAADREKAKVKGHEIELLAVLPTDAEIYEREFGPEAGTHILKVIATADTCEPESAHLPSAKPETQAESVRAKTDGV